MRTQEEESKLIDKIVNILFKYDKEIIILATNQYHNSDTSDNLELIMIKLRIFYGNQVLNNKVTLNELEITLANS